MKQTYPKFVIAIAVVLAFTFSASAQIDLGIDPDDMPDLSRFFMDNTTEDSAVSYASFEINDRAVKNFRKQFPDASHAAWYTVEEGYLVSFEEKGTATRVVFDRHGRFHHKISSYGPEKLPQAISSVLENEYDDYSILNVSEITFNDLSGEPIYVVRLENCNRLKIVTLSSETIFSVKSYRKG